MSGWLTRVCPWLAMRVLRLIRGNLQAHILSLFSLLLFASFIIVGLTFNFLVHRYISTVADEALYMAMYGQTETPARRRLLLRVLDGRAGFSHRDVMTFHTYRSELGNPVLSPTAALILEQLQEGNYSRTRNGALRMQLGRQTVYVRTFPHFPLDEVSGTYFYINVSEVYQFASLVNRLLLLLGGIVWIVAIVVSGFISDLLVRPLRKLRDFVFQIGNGDFTPVDFKFASEEMQELNLSLNNAARQLASYDNEQKTFFQNVSHDLRTPLMAIKSYSEGIKYGIMDPVDACDTIIKAADRLTGMVDDIMYVSRLDSLTLPKMGRDNLTEIVAERIMQHRAYAKSLGLSIKFSSSGGSLMIVCVTQFIERAVDNLISNALRYAVSWVKVECKTEGNRVVLRVSDDGPGFDKDTLPHVFERFYKSKNGITGIGLSIVKSIADQHKALATAANGEDGGAVLTISFPRHRV